MGRRSVGPGLDVRVKALEEYAEAGVQSMLPHADHDDFFAAYGREVIPRFS